MMDTLHFDLTQNATRQHLIDILSKRMRAGGFLDLGGLVRMAGLFAKHYDTLDELRTTILGLTVPDPVKDDMIAVYEILASAEAQVHGCDIEETHFHEVGNADSVGSVLAVCIAIDAIDPEEITATAVQVGSGTVECAHGALDIPAPATAAILERYSVPVCETRLEGELCTPTSAALIAHFVERFV